MAIKCPLLDLPTELLCAIIDRTVFGTEDLQRYETFFNVAQTCKRLRDIVIFQTHHATKIICHAKTSKKGDSPIGPILPRSFYWKGLTVIQWVLEDEADLGEVFGAEIGNYGDFFRNLNKFGPIALQDHLCTCDDHQSDQSESQEPLMDWSSPDWSAFDGAASSQQRSTSRNAFINRITNAYMFGTHLPGHLYLHYLPSRYERMLNFLPYLDNITHLELGRAYEDHMLYEAALPGWPIAICTMSTLTTLELSRTKLETLPEDVGNLVKLVELRVLDNPFLARLPNTLHKLVHLTNLTLDWNAFVIFPESVCQIPNLVSLEITSNAVEEIPESIGNLTSLTDLALHWNRLRDLPDSIGDLPNLYRLTVYHNPLVDLPDSVAKLESWDLGVLELVEEL